MQIYIQTQPDDESCGPTSLHSVYQYYGKNERLATTLKRVTRLPHGGTVAAWLGVDALEQGNFQADLYVYNLNVFDPSWFTPKRLSRQHLAKRLQQQLSAKRDSQLHDVTQAYLRFLALGGNIYYKNLTPSLLKRIFALGAPIITGLSATFLYQSQREKSEGRKLIYDDIYGEPCGHFVVLCGYDKQNRHIVVADPHRENPISKNNYYQVSISRLLNAILLGVLTMDANLLVIRPRENLA